MHSYNEPVISYSDRLKRDGEWALSEAGKFFQEKDDVHATLTEITARLEELGIPYALVGGLALFQHGYRRFTEDVDLLVRKEDLPKIHERLEGRGYLPKFQGSKHLRDTRSGVAIEFLVAGDFPGDGRPKPVSFPDPAAASFDANGVRCVNLPRLVELKLASGMTQPDRLKDIADVQQLIALLHLDQSFAAELNPYVHEKFLELCDLQSVPKTYVRLWRNKWLTSDAESLTDIIGALREAADELERMLADGVGLEPGGVEDDYARLVTTDPEVARRYDMHDGSEFM
jgi:hypothetical protein